MRARRSLRLTIAALVLCALYATAAEKPYALIFGTVWGAQNEPLYGVKVKIRRASDKKAKWELYSDHRGEFAQRVPPGPADYVVWAEPAKEGHGPKHSAEPVKVHIESDERQDIGLHLK